MTHGRLRPAVTQGYDADAWAAGPAPVYDRLAEAVVGVMPTPLDGALVLDLGAGTGAASLAISRRGGRVAAADLSHEMLHFERARRPPATVGDAGCLPLRDASVDGVVAAFSLTHVEPPSAGLVEAARVTKRGGWVLASSFAEERHPAKDAVDGAAGAHGWTPPEWYARFKRDTEPQFTNPDRLAALAVEAGLDHVDVQTLSVDTGLHTADEIVRYRFGMAQFSPFVEGLDPPAREALRRDAVDAVGELGEPMRALILVLQARA